MKHAVLLALALAGATPAGAVARYAIRDLGTLGGSGSLATAVNASGQVTGYSLTSTGGIRAFRTDGAGAMTALGTFGADYSVGTGINNAGQVSGYSYTTGFAAVHAFRADSTGTLTDLGTLGGSGSLANGINNAGEVVGTSVTSTGQDFTFRTDAAGVMQAVGATRSTGLAINDAGQIAGYRFDTATLRYGAIRIETDGTTTELGTFGGSRSQAYGINASGQVVGYATTERDMAAYAFRTDSAGTLVSLGTIGTAASYAYGINSAGQVVGLLRTGGVNERAMFHDGAAMFDLNDLVDPVAGVVLNYASAINDAGQIVGYGTFAGQTRAFRLDLIDSGPGAGGPGSGGPTPSVPEPATWAMLLLGFGLVGGAARRRKGELHA